MDVLNCEPAEAFRWLKDKKTHKFSNGCHLRFEDGDLWGTDPYGQDSFYADLTRTRNPREYQYQLKWWVEQWNENRDEWGRLIGDAPLKAGDKVAFVNDAGFIWPGKTITCTVVMDGQVKYLYAPHEAYWYADDSNHLWKEPLTSYQKYLIFLQAEAPKLGDELELSVPLTQSQECELGPEGLALYQADVSRLRHLEWLFRLEYRSHVKKYGLDYKFTP